MTTEIASLVSALEFNISQVVLGKPEVVRMCLVALLAGEHVLLEDVPGVGKTTLARRLAESYGARGHRITEPDALLPRLRGCLEAGGVHVIEVPIDYAENANLVKK